MASQQLDLVMLVLNKKDGLMINGGCNRAESWSFRRLYQLILLKTHFRWTSTRVIEEYCF
jgi:hypothetical protein